MPLLNAVLASNSERTHAWTLNLNCATLYVTLNLQTLFIIIILYLYNNNNNNNTVEPRYFELG